MNTLPNRIAAPPADQFNYALRALGDQSLHMVISFGGFLDEGHLRTAAAAVIAGFPLLGSRFVECDKPYWEVLPDIDFNTLVRIHVSCDPDADLPAILAIPVDPATGPQLCLHLIRSGDRDTLCITVHHAAMDARGLISCTQLLAESYRSADFRTVPHGETMDRSLGPVLAQIPDKVIHTIHPAPEIPPKGWAFPVSENCVKGAGFTIRTLLPSYLAAIKQAGKRQGATVNDVLLAAYFRALCTTIHPAPGCRLPVMVSIDLRRYLNGSRPVTPYALISNQSVAFAVMIKPDGQNNEGMIANARDAMRVHKAGYPGIAAAIETESFGNDTYTRICERVQAMKDTYAACQANPPFLANIGIIPEECVAFDPDLPVVKAFVAGIVIEPPGIALGVTTFKDQITLVTGYGVPAIPPAAMEAFMDLLISYLPRS